MKANYPHKSTTHKELYAHIRDPVNKWSGCTVFARLEDDGWYCSAALCLTVDQFCKRTGRTIARRKYMQVDSEGYHDKSNRLELNIPIDKVPTFDDLGKVYLDFAVMKTKE